eukprot:4284569-Pleurochrysis_carterae.AAC.2
MGDSIPHSLFIEGGSQLLANLRDEVRLLCAALCVAVMRHLCSVAKAYAAPQGRETARHTKIVQRDARSTCARVQMRFANLNERNSMIKQRRRFHLGLTQI